MTQDLDHQRLDSLLAQPKHGLRIRQMQSPAHHPATGGRCLATGEKIASEHVPVEPEEVYSPHTEVRD